MFKRFTALVALVCCIGLSAAPWFARNVRRPETLLVVGNYISPYMLAETYQGLTKQPYLRVMNDGRLFMVMPKFARGIAPRELAGVIDNFNFKRIVILGDERYISIDFEKQLRKSNIRATPVVRIYGENWLRVAEELDELLNVGHLARNFRENLQEASIQTNPAQLQVRQRRDAAQEENAPAEPAENVTAEAAPAPAPASAGEAVPVPVDPVAAGK